MVRINGLQPSKWTVEETSVGDIILRNDDTGQEFTFQDAGELDVPVAPSTNTGVARKAETDDLDSRKAPKDGGGTADLQNYASVGASTANITTGNIDGGAFGNEARWWPANRNLISNDILDYTATDAADAQNWIEDNLPLIQNHRVQVTIPTGDYTTPIEIPPQAAGGRWTRRGGSGLRPGLIIQGGDSTDRTATKIPWIAGGGCKLVTIRHLTFKEAATDWGEPAGVLFYDSGEVALNKVGFSGGTDGVVAYASQVALNDVDFGASVLTGTGVNAKHGGRIQEESTAATPTSGTVGGIAYSSSGLVSIQDESSTLTGGNGLMDDYNGALYGAESGSWYTRISGAVTQFYQGMRGGRPSPVVQRAAYLDDGSGTPAAGWYITTDGGSTWTGV